MQARSANTFPIMAFERNASPLFSTRVSSSLIQLDSDTVSISGRSETLRCRSRGT